MIKYYQLVWDIENIKKRRKKQYLLWLDKLYSNNINKSKSGSTNVDIFSSININYPNEQLNARKDKLDLY